VLLRDVKRQIFESGHNYCSSEAKSNKGDQRMESAGVLAQMGEPNTVCMPTQVEERNRKFQPGGIHKPEVRQFWKTVLNAGDWVMNVLEKGYVLPLKERPEQYEEKNNRSARENMEFVRETVEELERLGIVRFTDEKPHCVSPLSIAEKAEGNGKKKLRLVWDGSRCINPILDKQKVTLAHLHKCLEITEAEEFQVIYDLKSAFHHIRISESQTKYLGASFLKKNGNKQYFIYLYLPFGASTAVHCITKLFKPLNAYFHSQGIKHGIFIDDGRILAADADQAEKKREFVYSVLEQAGWTIEARKSDGKGAASQVKKYLGFIIDTMTMTVRLPAEKKSDIQDSIKKLIRGGPRTIHIKDLAKVLGKMISTEPALGNLPILTARPGYAQVEEASEDRGWNAQLELAEDTLFSLQFFLDNMEQFDDTPIRTAATEVSVISIIGPPDNFIKTGFVANHVKSASCEIWASDASGFATCAYSIQGKPRYYRGLLTDEERRYGSGHRELLAVRHSLEYYYSKCSFGGESCNVYWLTDSENLVRFLTKGSRKKHIQQEVFRVILLCQKLRIRVIPIHLRREDPRIQIADSGSKDCDTDDWAVDLHTFRELNQSKDFTIDLFASDKNNKCTRFFSNYFCTGTNGIDAFCHSWEGEVAWACPPISLACRTIRKIRSTQMSGVLFVPEWQTADYWTEIFDKKGQMLGPFTRCRLFRPFIMQGDFNHKSPFRGRVNFNFLALDF